MGSFLINWDHPPLNKNRHLLPLEFFDDCRKIISSPGLSVPPEQVSQSLWWVLKSPKTSTLADELIDRISSMSMLHETQSELKPIWNLKLAWNLKLLWEVVPFTWQTHGKFFMTLIHCRHFLFTWKTHYGLKFHFKLAEVKFALKWVSLHLNLCEG